jgi:TonB family protein
MRGTTLFVMLLTAVAAAQTDDVATTQEKLKQVLTTQQLHLRAPYSARIVTFDDGGKCSGTCELGTWAADSTVLVRKVEVAADSVAITADRLCVYFDQSGTAHALVTPYPVKLVVAVAGPMDVQSASQVLTKVFLPSNASDPSQSPPDPALNVDPPLRKKKLGWEVRDPSSGKWIDAGRYEQPVSVGKLPDGETVYLVSKAIKPPRALKTPDPVFPPAERAARHTGTVVLRVVIGSNGLPEAIAVEKTPSPALAQPSVLAVSTWTFEPATHAGRPVASEVHIEVNFALY